MTTVAIETPHRMRRAEEPEWIVWATVILMLAVGLVLRVSTERRMASFSQGGLSLRYPVGWTSMAADTPGHLLYVADPFSAPQSPTGVQVWQVPTADVSRRQQSLGDLALAWSAQQARELASYRVLGVEATTVNNQQAVAIDYAYVAEPTIGTAAASIPVVVQAQDVLVVHGDTLTIVTFAADANVYQNESETWHEILAALSFPRQ
jgi:hypothetical protein